MIYCNVDGFLLISRTNKYFLHRLSDQDFEYKPVNHSCLMYPSDRHFAKILKTIEETLYNWEASIIDFPRRITLISIVLATRILQSFVHHLHKITPSFFMES